MSEARAVRVAAAFALQAASIPPARLWLCRACAEALDVSGAGVTVAYRCQSPRSRTAPAASPSA